MFLEVIYFKTLELIVSKKLLEDCLRAHISVVSNKYMFLNSKFSHGLLTVSSSKVFALSGALVKTFKSLFVFLPENWKVEL